MRKIYFLLAFLLTPLVFYAWGKEGHMIVAEIAKSKLKKGVAEKVQEYFGATTFEEAAVWMDEVKSDHTLDYMKVWHFVNIEENETYKKSEDGDLVSELKLVITELKKYKSMDKEEVSKDLKILFHLCGDITQPMHTGYGSDRGGNDVKLKYHDTRTNLHHVWDTDIIAGGNITLDSCLQIASKWTEKEKSTCNKINVLEWMQDSRNSLFTAYNIKNKTITDEYILINKKIVANQLIKGGYRLAAVLNDIFSNEQK
jgi:hypothetical protein